MNKATSATSTTNATAARRLMRSHHAGVLATLSKKFTGFPFASVVSFALDHQAQPLMLISRLAEHTKNIDQDPRVSLLAREPDADPQANARLTLVGDARPIALDACAQARYCRLRPDAAGLLALGDFSFYRIMPTAIRFIEGFGAIHWVGAAAYAPPANAIEGIEDDIIDHMNLDHAAALRDYARAQGVTATATALAGIDCDGIDVRADDTLLRFNFDEPVVDARGARLALVDLARRTRDTLATRETRDEH